ncbi:hypothetical protein CRG98_001223 [Punica granatum]|uniref:Uncharacterized protein n=1 Tax=Punica granatum TaxID=22663 RepID=A0A2I0LCK4_PUNGR|nr:hypothetical protein CRG98_001223 [Punica granatum]
MLYLASGYEERVGEVFVSRVTRLNAWKGARVQRMHDQQRWARGRTSGARTGTWACGWCAGRRRARQRARSGRRRARQQARAGERDHARARWGRAGVHGSKCARASARGTRRRARQRADTGALFT